jgi:hypothetical protein
MVFVIAKLRSNNLEKRGPSKEFFIGENSNYDIYI